MYLTTRRPGYFGPDLAGLRRLNQVLDETFAAFPRAEAGPSARLPVVDILEDEEGLRLVAELPGVRAGDVKLSVERGVLTLQAGTRPEATEETGRVHRRERRQGSFARSFTLPETVDAGRIEAAFADGVLTVRLPKAEQAKPREIAVTAG